MKLRYEDFPFVEGLYLAIVEVREGGFLSNMELMSHLDDDTQLPSLLQNSF